MQKRSNEPCCYQYLTKQYFSISFIRWIGKPLSKIPQSLTCSTLRFQKTVLSMFRTTPRCCVTPFTNADAVLMSTTTDANFQSLDYINEYRPSYVKLDYLFTHNLDDEKQKFTLTSISRTAHNLGVTTIASRIETQTQLDILSDNYVEVFQSFIVDK